MWRERYESSVPLALVKRSSRALVDDARESGWTIATTRCHPLQAHHPFLALRRLVEEWPDSFAAEASVEERFLMLLEGLSTHPLAILIDDIHWADAASVAVLTQALSRFADHAFIVVSTERTGERTEARADRNDTTVALGTLHASASHAIARAHYPGAGDIVIASIVAQANGHASDLVALAKRAYEHQATTATDVRALMNAMLAGEIAALPNDQREFLHICALIAEPIDLPLLHQLWPDETTLLAMIERSAGRYLVQDGATLRFTHVAIAHGIRASIPLDIPLRRRIIGAIQRQPRLRLEDYERIAEQAACCGDRVTEHTALLNLAQHIHESRDRRTEDRRTAKKPTRREYEIIALVASGLSNREIAITLSLSERTIDAHLSNVFAKVEVSSRSQLTAWYMRFIAAAATGSYTEPGLPVNLKQPRSSKPLGTD